MSEKRRGLGRGLGALIPTGLDGQRPSGERPVDVFFPDARRDNGGATDAGEGAPAPSTEQHASDGAAAASGSDGTAARGDSVPTNGTTTVAAVVQDATTTESSRDGVDGSVSVGAAPTSADAAADAGPGAGDKAGSNGTSTHAVPDTDPDGLVPVPGARFAELPVGAIRPNPRQPRTVFDEEALEELVGSIREIGVLQPVVVRAVGDSYELIMGERRWRATQAAGLDTIPAIVRDTEDSDLLRDALLENLHRAQLNPLEEAAAYQQLLDDFGCTHEELATRIHRSRPQISNTLRLLKLPPLVQRRVAAGVLSAGHARALLGLSDGAAIERLAQRIVAEGLSVRAVEEIVSLGVDGAPPTRRAAPRAGDRNAALDDLAARLSDRFDTRVKVALGKTRGRLTVEFASVQDLNRILESLAPEDPGLLKS
ncbi:ParB/RepB/Spo0J family partition protein [Cellulomonas sp. H30R-01]|uniref:ParB/RepB/Spo0J family partition protein n=1 Tax=Cellulomonas sp. H30R-01 TaxID=2704467 RepID=UPI00138CFEBE|nr:ParB/RepB/Spo0J family partition protein [Cellulomonas sp. H30R-01]QHT57519.1 ParB/RepB/Spo0J family partition protein [Cellulomonas sp. H30R-01]